MDRLLCRVPHLRYDFFGDELSMKIGSNAGMPPFPAVGIRFTAAGVLLVDLRGGIFRRGGRSCRGLSGAARRARVNPVHGIGLSRPAFGGHP